MIRSCFRHLFMRKLYISLIINVDILRCGCPNDENRKSSRKVAKNAKSLRRCVEQIFSRAQPLRSPRLCERIPL